MFIPIAKKRLIPVTLLLISVFTPLIYFSYSNKVKKSGTEHTQVQATKIKHSKNQRHVTKFTNDHPSTESLFTKIKKQIETSNMTIDLISNSYPAYRGFGYKVKYDYYDKEGVLKNQITKEIKSNTNINGVSATIDVATQYFLNMQVEIVGLPHQKFASISNTNFVAPDFTKIKPSSFSFAVEASGDQSTSEVKLEENYVERGSTKKESKSIGNFSVYNFKNSFTNFFTSKVGIVMIVGLIGILYIFGGLMATFMKKIYAFGKAMVQLSTKIARSLTTTALTEAAETASTAIDESMTAAQATRNAVLEESEMQQETENTTTRVHNVELENTPESNLGHNQVVTDVEVHPQTNSLEEVVESPISENLASGEPNTIANKNEISNPVNLNTDVNSEPSVLSSGSAGEIELAQIEEAQIEEAQIEETKSVNAQNSDSEHEQAEILAHSDINNSQEINEESLTATSVSEQADGNGSEISNNEDSSLLNEESSDKHTSENKEVVKKKWYKRIPYSMIISATSILGFMSVFAILYGTKQDTDQDQLNN